jgi:hypothetical protein
MRFPYERETHAALVLDFRNTVASSLGRLPVGFDPDGAPLLWWDGHLARYSTGKMPVPLKPPWDSIPEGHRRGHPMRDRTYEMENLALTHGESMLNTNTMRLLHRFVDDFVFIRKVRSGTVSEAELGRVLRDSGADSQEIQDVLADYRRHRSEMQAG